VRVGDVVRFVRYEPPHHAVVLRVAETHLLIACSTSHRRDMDGVAVNPRTREAFSLGWGPHDNRTSYFYRSGLHVVALSEIESLQGGPRRCHPDLFARLLTKAAEWTAAGDPAG
jgi:hypothetical protein